MDTYTDDDYFVNGDYIKYLNTPRKQPSTLFDATYQSIGQRSTLGRVVGTVLAVGLVTIVVTYVIFSSSPYYPLQYDLAYIPFSLAYLLLILTSFLAGTMIQFIVFRMAGGIGRLMAHGYLNAIGYVWSLVLSGLGILILIITRAEIISILAMGLGGLYLIYVTYLSLKAIHSLSTNRSIVAIIISTIIMVPEVTLHFYLFGYFRESRPFTIYNEQLIVSILSMFLVDLFILAYMSFEHKFASDYPNGVPLQEVARKIFTSKRIVGATIAWLLISSAVVSLNIRILSLPEPTVLKSSGFIPLDFDVIDAEYNVELDRIVMVTSPPYQLHLYDPVLQDDKVIDLSEVSNSLSISPNGKFVAVTHKNSISYFDLLTGNLTQVFETNENEQVLDIILGNEYAFYVSAGLNSRRSQKIRSINLRTGQDELVYSLDGFPIAFDLYVDESRIYGNYFDATSPQKILRIDISDGKNLADRTVKVLEFLEDDPSGQQNAIQSVKTVELSEGYPDSATQALTEPTYYSDNSLWLSADGKLMIGSRSKVFTTSPDSSQDMQYVTSLTGAKISDLAQTSITNQLLIVSDIDREVTFINYETLEKEKEVYLPEFRVTTWTRENWISGEKQVYPSYGQFVFVNNANTHYYVIVRADPASELNNDFAIVIGNFIDDE